MSANQRRGPWSNTEDAVLMNLVANQGALNWVRISQHLGSRTPKQCRERYHQNLKPTLNHDPITPDEGVQIERLVNEIGKRWAEIARRLHGRSDNAVKNWWNGSQNRRKRHDRRKDTHITGHYDNRTKPCSHTRPVVPLAYPRQMEQLPLHGRPLPRPISPGYAQRAYGVETPLASPSALSPRTNSDRTPSLLSDDGSSYTTSPRTSIIPCSPIELPPLKNQGNMSPQYTTSPVEGKLPGLSSVTYPYYGKEEMALPPLLSQAENYPPRSHLPTAPNSPAGPALPSLRNPMSRAENMVESGAERHASRIDVSALLG